ncbi:hypothetical protein PV328_010887 [Microctonus aethiopoides]|uniref:Uncharacterized protein n=1 Tax=Microctonus aethiopoides TaxID=144406 RepID=A0AA39FIQ3_9HYME|nr:hypothetical protein PV328_010887 [Microctonus aethiopoides]
MRLFGQLRKIFIQYSIIDGTNRVKHVACTQCAQQTVLRDRFKHDDICENALGAEVTWRQWRRPLVTTSNNHDKLKNRLGMWYRVLIK